MKDIYEVGKPYIVVQTETGEYIGEEVIVIDHAQIWYNEVGHLVDLVNKFGQQMYAVAGQLRPKSPPSGEKLINAIIEGKIHVQDNVKEKENA